MTATVTFHDRRTGQTNNGRPVISPQGDGSTTLGGKRPSKTRRGLNPAPHLVRLWHTATPPLWAALVRARDALLLLTGVACVVGAAGMVSVPLGLLVAGVGAFYLHWSVQPAIAPDSVPLTHNEIRQMLDAHRQGASVDSILAALSNEEDG